MKSKQIRNSLLLFLAACIWGVAFVSQSKGMEYMKPFTFNAARNLLGSLVLLPVIFYRRRRTGLKSQNINWKTSLCGGICCGIALTLGSMLQQYGITYTSVGKAGFITTLYILFTPIFGLFLRKKVSGIVWISCILAAVGMYFLCMTETMQVNPGDTMVFLCAMVFAIHILIIDYFSPKVDGVILSCIQFFVSFLLSAIGAVLFDQPSAAQLYMGIIPILYAGILSSGVAYTLQIIGQKDMNPTVSALILSLESVVATISAYLAYQIGFLKTDQTLTTRQILGCIIVFAAILLVQIFPLKKSKACVS